MVVLSTLYLKGFSRLDARPDWMKDWRFVLFCCLAVYAVVLLFRVSMAGRWDHPDLWVNGERILATHDAYYWLAKAKGVGRLHDYPLAEATSWFHGLTGLGFGSIGFWGPAVFGAVVSIVCAFWGYLLAGRAGCIFPGLVGAITPGFFFRSRLGYFDTDMFTLLAPLSVSAMLAVLAYRYTKRAWFIEPDGGRTEYIQSTEMALLLAFVFGITARFLSAWHHYILHISILLFLLACVFVAINGIPGRRGEGFYCLAVFLLAAFPGASYSKMGYYPLLQELFYGFENFYIGLSVALAFLYVFLLRRNSKLLGNWWFGLIALLCAMLLAEIIKEPIVATWDILSKYLNHSEAVVGASNASTTVQSPIYPSIVKSIIEAKLVPISVILERGAFAATLGWFSLIAAAVVAIFRPIAVLLLPFIGLHLLSINLGIRFSMFGGAAMMVLLGVALNMVFSFLLKEKSWQYWGKIGGQVVFAMAIMGYCYFDYSKLPLTPAVTKAHAESLIELGKTSDEDSILWTWWDWGYASQYYAGLRTTVDGGRHSGKDVYPTALTLSTTSMVQANQLIKTVASEGYNSATGMSLPSVWASLSGPEAMDKINALTVEGGEYAKSPDQYLVVTWKDLVIMKWITYFGNWDLGTGSTRQATIANYEPGALGFNIKKGAVMNRKGSGGLVSDITLLRAGEAERIDYYMNKLSPGLLRNMPHLVINEESRQSVMMDRTGYQSVTRRLLTEDPNTPEISKYFELVVDKLPFARIYKVIQ